MKKAYELVTTVTPEITQHSPHSGFNGYSVLSPVTGLFVTVILEKLASRKLDASAGASGPHDFAVRVSAVRQKRFRVHCIPRPTSVTIAIRPPCGNGMRGRCS